MIENQDIHSLIIGEENSELKQIKEELQTLKIVVHQPTSEETAKNHILQNDFDIVLLAGSQCIKWISMIRKQKRFFHLPILLFGTRDEIEPGILSYCNLWDGIDYILKPINSIILRAKVRALVSLKNQTLIETALDYLY